MKQRRITDKCGMIGLMVALAHQITLPCAASSIANNRLRVSTAQNEINTNFLNAAEAGNLRSVRSLLKQGAAVNTTQENGWTPLMLAARNGHAKMVGFLLKHGANPHQRSKLHSDYRALELAAGSGDIATTKLILNSGIDVNEADDLGDTPLAIVAGNGNLSPRKQSRMVTFLIRRGAKIDILDKQGYTPLSVAENTSKIESRYKLITKLIKKEIAEQDRRNHRIQSTSGRNGANRN